MREEKEGRRTYTINDLRDILGISRSSAQRLVQTGKFRSVRIGGSIRIVKSSFDAWLNNGDGQSYTSGRQGIEENTGNFSKMNNSDLDSSETVQKEESKIVIRYIKTGEGMYCLNSEKEKDSVLKLFMEDPHMVARMKEMLGNGNNLGQ